MLDARLALAPDGTRLAIFEKKDDHLARTSRWRLRLVDLRGAEREVIPPQVDRYEEVPWDVGFSPGGALLLASRPLLARIEPDGRRALVQRFPDGTVGVTFRDPAHPGLVVSQTSSTLSIYVVDADGTSARLARERPFLGLAGYARRPLTDDIVELSTRFDGSVTYALLHAGGGEDAYVLEGPRVEGAVELVGTTPDSFYLLWPVARDTPAALRTIGTAFLQRASYDGRLTVVDATRNWSPSAPFGVSPDGRALLVPQGQRRGGARFALEVCCARRPAAPLLPPADRVVIGWLEAP